MQTSCWLGGPMRTALLTIFTLVGAAAGAAISWTVPERGTQQWLVFAALATTPTGVAGFVFGYGLNRWHDLPTGSGPTFGVVATAALFIGVLAIAIAYVDLAH